MNSMSATSLPQVAVRRLRQITELPPLAPAFTRTCWEHARDGDAVERDDEARALAMLDHPEFYVLWEDEAQLPDSFRIGDMNPRLHLLVHQIVENQLLLDDPPEGAQAVDHLLALGLDRHQAVHLVIEPLVNELHVTLRDRRPADMPAYCRRLAALARAVVRAPGASAASAKRPGRNDPCPCGSGKKYKKCCAAADAPALVLNPEQGLVADFVEALYAVALALEDAGLDAPAADAYRRLVAAAEASGDHGYLHDALHDQLFCARNQGLVAEGMVAAQRLIEMATDPEQVAQYRLELADLHDMAGDTEQAESIYRAVMATDPRAPYCHLRWARRLADRDDTEEAEQVYRRIIQQKGMGDRDALADAKDELAELLKNQRL